MANLNLGQDVANNRERKSFSCSYSGQIYSKLKECVVTVLLLTSTPLVNTKSTFFFLLSSMQARNDDVAIEKKG